MNREFSAENRKIIYQFRITAAVAVVTLLVGVVFYHFQEGFKWLDSLYFCVITLTTIGYGDLAPHTDAGKMFTIVYVLVGVGIIAAFINITVQRSTIPRRQRLESRSEVLSERTEQR